MKYRELAMRLTSAPLALLPAWGERLSALILAHRPGDDVSDADMEETFGASVRANTRGAGDVGVVSIMGFIQQREDFWTRYGYATSVDAVARRVEQLAGDPSVKAIVFDVDSPGGLVSGVEEAAAAIFALRERKPMIAVSNALMCSAAYHLASAAHEIVASPSSYTGSIGVWRMHIDQSRMLDEAGVAVTLVSAGKHKVDGHPYGPLPDDVRAQWEAEVADVHERFIGAVAKHRGVAPSAVRGGYGEGQVMMAGEALKAGMVDRVASFEETLRRFGATGGSARRGDARAEVAAARLALWKALGAERA